MIGSHHLIWSEPSLIIGLTIKICPFGLTSVREDVRGQLQHRQTPTSALAVNRIIFFKASDITQGLCKGQEVESGFIKIIVCMKCNNALAAPLN